MSAFIVSTRTEETGGGCRADLLTLASGHVVYITDECIGVAANEKAWQDSSDLERYLLTSNHRNYRTLRSPVGLTFVRRITTFEPDGPVSVDLVHLVAGSVLGIDAESIVLYPSQRAFDEMCAGGAQNFHGITLDEPVVDDDTRSNGPWGRRVERDERDGGVEDSPSLDNCDDAGTGEGRWHGRM